MQLPLNSYQNLYVLLMSQKCFGARENEYRNERGNEGMKKKKINEKENEWMNECRMKEGSNE